MIVTVDCTIDTAEVEAAIKSLQGKIDTHDLRFSIFEIQGLLNLLTEVRDELKVEAA